MNQQRRAPQRKRKMPLKKRLAYLIVNIADEIEKSKAEKQRKQGKHPAQKRRPAPSGQRPAPGRQRPAPGGQRSPRNAQQRRPLTPQEKKRQAAMRAKQQRKRLLQIRIGIAAVAALVILLILSRTVLFKIQHVEVSNPEVANYTVDQIAEQSGVVKGADNLFSKNLGKVEKNIEQRLPYIGKAEVKRDFPSTLVVTVTPTKSAAAIAYGTGYLLVDIDGKMLENTLTAPDNIPVLRCNTEFELVLGQYIGVTDDKDEQDKAKAAKDTIDLFKRIMEAMDTVGLTNITLIDIRDTHAITLMYENRLTLHVGTEEQLSDKLALAVKTIAMETDTSANRTGAINLEDAPYAYAKDTFENIPAEESTQEPSTQAQ